MRRGPRSFDPVLLGQRECAAWAAYYRHERGRVLVSSIGLVRAGFGMAWPRTLLGAWYVLRANQARALSELYAHVYDIAPEAVTEAAQHRVVAMRLSDEWVEAGCDRDDPRLADECRELIASYTALSAVVARPL